MLQVAQIHFPVGHGGLHLTQLVSPWSSYPAVNVIYDCGTRSRKRVLEESLNVLQYCSFSLSRPQPHIDLLILSHLHNDHINGFEMLQQKIAPSIDRLAIPHYDDEDKLVVLAQAASSGATTRQIARLHEVLTDPAAWFRARGVRQILAVAPGSPTAEPPPSPVPPLPDDGPPEGYRLVGWPDPAPERPTTEAYVPKRASISGPSYGTYVVLPPGSVLRILSPATRTSVAFVVIPYCLRSIPGRGGHRCRQQFVQAVDRVLHPYRNGASLIIKSKHARTVLQSLKSAFVSYVDNSGTVANRLSLLSYIGFDCISPNTCFTYLQTCAPHCMPCGSIFWNFLDWSWPAKKRVLRPPRRASTCGWLITGDADLRRDTEWKKYSGSVSVCRLFYRHPITGRTTVSQRPCRAERAVFSRRALTGIVTIQGPS
ncbi:MAG: MBL fold metallo-hydrolase [Geminicoccaceae bacterium]|nr:MBL fold metallo-hydrolase [Geminicoccaceae bacterium]